MAIIGDFRVEIPKKTLENMKINTSGYIFCTEFILSKSLLCIALNTEVFYNIEDILEADLDNYVSVHKIKNGLTADCFDIDLEHDGEFNTRDWYIYPGLVAQQYLKSTDWVCFENPPIFYDEVSFEDGQYNDTEQINQELENIDIILEPITIKKLSLEKLSRELEKAVKSEDYDSAIKIRNEINHRNKKKK